MKLTATDRSYNATIAKALEVDGAVQLGDTERSVRGLERMLRQAGFDVGTFDESFDDRTQAALERFQASVGLEPTGVLDARTFAKLKGVQLRERTHEGTRLGLGQAGKDVFQVETRLRRLGYDTGKVDGIYDQATAEAAKAFKHDQKALRASDGNGQLGTSGRAALRREVQALAHDPYRTRIQRGHKQHRRLDALTTGLAGRRHADGSVGIGLGAKNRAVRNVQARLSAAGFDPKRHDGVMDERTVGALKAFQRRAGLPETGRVTPMTWKRLSGALLYATGDASPVQRVGEHSAAVLRSEKLLKKLGFDPGKVDGVFDERTRRASERFENKYLHGQGAGEIGEGQLKKLKKVLADRQLPTKLATGYRSGSPYQVKIALVDGHWTGVGTAKAFLKMQEAARRDGISLHIVSGFRTWAEQDYLYRTKGPQWAARPGYSNHQNGSALDLNTGGFGTATYNWLMRNGPRFGFQRTVPHEDWHFEYHG